MASSAYVLILFREGTQAILCKMSHFGTLGNAFGALVQKLSLFGAIGKNESRSLLLLGHIFFVPDQILIGRWGDGLDGARKTTNTNKESNIARES
jgi:hypothetical protein